MDITALSGLTLIFLFLFSYFCGFILKITSDKFYQPFHFAGGFLVFVFIDSFINNRGLSLILSVGIGIVWEIYEWLLWRYVLKKKLYKPKGADTKDDLIKGFLGGITALILKVLLA